jgi:hypothetical protein
MTGAWIAERKDVPSTFFGILAVVSTGLALALISKPTLVTLPLGRVRLEPGQRQAWMQLLREQMPLFLPSAASSVATVVAQSRGGTIRNFENFPLSVRMANAVASYVECIAKMLWPGNLAPFYPHLSLPGSLVAGSLLALIAVSVLGICLVRKHPHFLVGWPWHVGTVVPVMGLVQVGSQAKADRYAHVPKLMGSERAPRALGWPRGDSIQTAAGLLIIGALMVAARNQIRYCESALAGNHYISRTLLGSALAKHGDRTRGPGAVFFGQGRFGGRSVGFKEKARGRFQNYRPL